MNDMNIASLGTGTARAMLAYLGVAHVDQPSNIGEIRYALDKYKVIEPRRFAAAWKAVVDGDLSAQDGPDTAPERGEAAEHYADFAAILAELQHASARKVMKDFSTEVDEVKYQAETHFQELAEVFKKSAQEAIEVAANDVRKVQVEITSSTMPSVVIEDPVPQVFERVLQLANQRRNILLVGPTGCGKTHLARVVAQALQLDYAALSCTEGMNESQLTGWLLPVGEAGRFEYVQSEFVRVYENGGVFLFDELDASDPNVLVFVNQALAQDHFFLPQRYTQPMVKRHPNFVAIAAANTFGSGADAMFVGRNQLDEATLNRFKIGTVYMDYDEAVEHALVKSLHEETYNFCIAIRDLIKKHRLRRSMSTRNMLDALRMVLNEKWSMPQVADGYFADWSLDEREYANGITWKDGDEERELKWEED